MNVVPLSTGVYLDQALAPFAAFIARDDVTDIHVNRPGELWIETTRGGTERHDAPALTFALLDRLVAQVAALTHQGINRQYPLLAATLPGGARVQAVVPPATRADVALSIRKHQVIGMRLDDYVTSGAFADLSTDRGDRSSIDAELATMRQEQRFGDLLRYAVQTRRNMLISGGTSTGKTTFLNALLKEVDAAERLILIEDTPELQLTHANQVGLLAARGSLGEAEVTADDLVAAALRMRPDRIILGELRGREALAFLRAINTGHPGSMTTVHADSPERAVEQIALLVLQAGTTLTRGDIAHYVKSTIDVYVQLQRADGARRVSDIVLSSS
jgi:type IV secretion system protein VirB11